MVSNLFKKCIISGSNRQNRGCFTNLIIKVGEALSQSKILCQLYHGGLSTYNRKQGLQRFNHDPTMRVMVMSLKAGGIGLNLQRANHMVILDRWWNPATMDQAVARIHRMTQAKQTYNKLFQQIVENEDVDGENVEEDIKELEISEAQEQVQTDDVDDAEEEEDDDDEMHELEIIIPNDKRKPAEVITLDDDDDIPTTLKEITIGDNGSNYFDPITLDDDMDDELHEIEIIIRNDEQESFSKDFSKDFPRDFFDEFSGEIQELENNITQEELCAFTEMDLT
ncbi:hypothetical protein G6F56_009089 [Rhizopus delemar]|nr:hypothetical protein G6F56_009089 [Rhizopus delemar]